MLLRLVFRFCDGFCYAFLLKNPNVFDIVTM